jgi:hypothetical protein
MVQTLNWPIILEELSAALKEMALSKAPGPDGVTTELYKHLWPTIGPDYLSMLENALAQGEFHHGVTEGLIALIHKRGGRSTLNNWSPITLLNVSYKIFAKTLQRRLQPILMEVISHDQSAFLSMRFILDNIFLTYETIYYANQSKKPLLFLKLDFSKVYDKVDLGFLFKALDQIGFPSRFLQMTQVLFKNAMARISVNKQSIEAFPIQQGVRQGCLLAPYLILSVGEFYYFQLRRKCNREGSEVSTYLAPWRAKRSHNLQMTRRSRFGERNLMFVRWSTP